MTTGMTSCWNRRWLILLAALCLLATACGADSAASDAPAGELAATDSAVGDADEAQVSPGIEGQGIEGQATVVIANSPGSVTTTGSQRILTALIGDGPNNFLGGPDQPVTIRFDAVNTTGVDDVTGEAPGSFLTTNASSLGLYVSRFEFPTPGLWEITVVSNGNDLGSALYEITEQSPIPTIGDPAPATDSLTGTTPEEIVAISTDQNPNPDFYDLTIGDAITNDRPSVIAFVTPAFCQTALCGPTLETVKEATAGRSDLDVVHVEPFDLELATQGTLMPIESMDDWGLQTEPWVFVVDADGVVAASFEGIIGLAELEDALAGLG